LSYEFSVLSFGEEEEKRDGNTEVTEIGTQRAQRRAERRRKSEALDRKSPPFAEEREGWGTLKYMCWLV